MPRVTLGFVPRERFSWAARSLRNLLETPAGIDYHLVIVDCAIPERYRAEIETLVAGRDNVEFIRLDHHVMPNESRHLVTMISHTEYTALLENDNYVEPNWLGALVGRAGRRLRRIRRHDVGAPDHGARRLPR